MFEQKVSERFAPTHEAERTHKLIKLEIYHGDIRQFLLRMEMLGGSLSQSLAR